MEAVILASGYSTRFPGYKLVARIAGLPLLVYPAASLAAAGVKRVVLVALEEWAGKLESLVEGFFDYVRVVVNLEPERENGYSFYLGLREASSEVVVATVADHVYPPRLVARTLGRLIEEEEACIVVAGERVPSRVNEAEATLILADSSGRVVRIGKGIPYYNYVDMGVFAVRRREALAIAEELVRQRERLKLAEVVGEAGLRGRAYVADGTGVPWADVDTWEEYEKLDRGQGRLVVSSILGELGGVIRLGGVGQA